MINKFSNKFQFLSNFYPEEMEYEGDIYASSEHAFQAAKATNEEDRLKVKNTATCGASKRAGRSIELRKDWEDVKDEIMLNILRAKFSNPNLAKMLLDTGEEELIEGNTWGDTYWGVCKGKGKNVLGKLLMKVREEHKAESKKE